MAIMRGKYLTTQLWWQLKYKEQGAASFKVLNSFLFRSPHLLVSLKFLKGCQHVNFMTEVEPWKDKTQQFCCNTLSHVQIWHIIFSYMYPCFSSHFNFWIWHWHWKKQLNPLFSLKTRVLLLLQLGSTCIWCVCS